MKTLLLLTALAVSLAGSLRAETVDRVAIAIGRQAVTESQIDEELRVTALLNHRPVVRDQNERRAAADRLIEQFLVRRESEVSRFPQPDSHDVDTYSAQIERDFGGAASLKQALKSYDLDQELLRVHLTLQLAALRFVEFRFRPEFSTGDPVVEQRTEQALNVWLREARRRFNIVYLDQGLK